MAPRSQVVGATGSKNPCKSGDRQDAGETPAILCRAAIVTAGTFLNGLMHLGEKRWPGGRYDEPAAGSLSDSLRRCGLELGRLKTGTPPRLAAETIDYSACTRQDGDEPPTPFSFLNERLDVEQIPCWLTATNPAVHEIAAANLHRAPMYTGQIQSVGPRYCPSFETKIVRFADKASHQVFLELEGRTTNWVYVNGMSTSLPADVQRDMLLHVPGLQRAEVLRWGYAIEYDFAQPTQLDSTLQAKCLRGLYLAGQINGTTGYEEAAALGLMAGVNAALAVSGREGFVLRRDQAYIGVMIDDLVTKGVSEPYRMFTSRAEHRLSLRSDNADRRLTPLGREAGLVDDARWGRYGEARAAATDAQQLLESARANGKSFWALLHQNDHDLAGLAAAAPPEQRERLAKLMQLQPRAMESLAIDCRYAGYLAKEQLALRHMEQLDSKLLPEGLDYAAVPQLRHEAKEKLAAVRPRSLGQALRVSGITPADIMILAVHLAARPDQQAGEPRALI